MMRWRHDLQHRIWAGRSRV